MILQRELKEVFLKKIIFDWLQKIDFRETGKDIRKGI